MVWESDTIFRYLYATCASTRLLPVDLAVRSAIERMMDRRPAALNSSMTALLSGYYRTPQKKRDTAMPESARKQAIGQWSIVEKWLDGRDYLAGSQATIAFIGNGIMVHRWQNYPIKRPNLPRIRFWYKRPAEPKISRTRRVACELMTNRLNLKLVEGCST